MEPTNFEKQRTDLLVFLSVIIMILSGLIMFLSYGQEIARLTPGLAVLSLFACLYALSKEQALNKLEVKLVRELIARNHQIDRLGNQLEDERNELEQEKGRKAEVERLLNEITNLYRAISVVNAEVEDDQVAGTVLRAALKLVGGNRGSIMLMDGSKEHLYIASALGLSDRVISATRQKVGQGVAGWVAQSGEPLLLNSNAQDDQRFVKPTDLTGQVHCSMCVPLKLKNEVIGVMNLSSTEQGNEFTDSHMRIATIFGQHASVSVMNARLMLSMGKAQTIDDYDDAYDSGGYSPTSYGTVELMVNP